MSTAAAIDPTSVPDGTDHGPDPEKGKLFDVARAVVQVDPTDPTTIRLTFSGKIDLERGNPSDVQFFNALKPGQPFELTLAGHVAGAKTTHRRDSEGDVDAVVAVKSLIVDSVTGLE